MNILEINNIVKDFIGHRALNNVSFNVPEGQIFGLLGPNGAGKTTTLRIVNQITYPDEGQIIFEGRPIKPSDTQNIGYLPEERGLYKKMKLGEQAIYLSRLKGMKKSEIVKDLHYWFEKFDLMPWWDKKVEDLSKGMAQKVQFIITIIHKPKLLIFDEPFSGFDPINANLLKEEILNLKKNGSTIIFSTHNMSSVEEICDEIVLLNKSEKVLEGKVDYLKNKFSENIYTIELDNIDGIKESDIYKIKSSLVEKGKLKAELQLNEDYSTNNMLNDVLKQGNIISLNKKVLTMNEIFIKTVQDN